MYKLMPILHVLSKLVMLFAGLFIFPSLVSIYYHDGALDDFLASMFVGLSVGLFLWAATRRYERELRPRDGFVLVSLLWIGFAATATTPFLLYYPHMNVAQAFFEAMSGLTTTGATVLSDLDSLPQSINFWRHFLSWLGGMGIIVLAVAVLPLLGVGGMQLYKAEMAGPMKDSKLTPRIMQTAKNLWTAYAALTLAAFLCLRLAGMSWFDALCHAFTSLSLGGFSSRSDSIAYFDSLSIELVMIVFMLLGAMNFANHFLAFRNRSIRHFLHDAETRSVLGVMGVSIIGLSGYLAWHSNYDYFTAMRLVSFNLVSVATGSGFVSADFGNWPLSVPLWMLMLSCFAVCTGSTGGGIKMGRALILFRQASGDIIRLLHPTAVVPVKINQRVVPPQVVQSILSFIFAYIACMVLSTFVFMMSGLDFLSAFTAVIACINNTGVGLGVVGPSSNFSVLNDFQIWMGSLLMLLGRLEIFTLLIIVTPAFWRK